jgi:hypothetical protein
MPLDHPSLVPEGHPAEANEHWTTSSMLSARTTRICVILIGTAETSSTPSGMADLSNLYHLPHHKEDPENLDNLSSKMGEEAEHSRTSMEKSTSSSADTGHKRTKGSRSSMIARYWWWPPVLPPRTFTQADQWLNFDHLGKYPLLVDPVIRESRVKKVLVDGGSCINITFPRTLLGLGVALKELHESYTPFFGIVPTEGEYPLGHIYMPVTFGTPENYRTEFLRFEIASFDCGYNAIIGRPGLVKFMAIPHYSYMILKMSGPKGIITVRADFQGAIECFRVAIQAALTTKPPTTPSAQVNSKPEEDLAIPANEAHAVSSMQPTEETKRINLRFADERKTTIISSSLNDK